jgi:methylated-DNA-[protein]-cysteine S-methyltransferase
VSAALVITTLASADGPYHVAVSERGVVAAETGGDRAGFEARVAERFRGLEPPTAAARRTYERIAPALESIVGGGSRDLGSVPIDLADRPAFDRAVLEAVRDIPWGRTASYGEIARRVGTPRAARAVGGAVARCPISVAIPCHRVIASDGTIGGYGGDGPVDRAVGLERKRTLLLREGLTVPDRGG